MEWMNSAVWRSSCSRYHDDCEVEFRITMNRSTSGSVYRPPFSRSFCYRRDFGGQVLESGFLPKVSGGEMIWKIRN